jgi:3-dehydroquinate synthase class II
VALLGQVYSGEQLDYLPAMMGGAETVVINDLDWQVCGKTQETVADNVASLQIIPPEDVVAAFQGRRTHLFATANTASDAQVYLEVQTPHLNLTSLIVRCASKN